jgi:hypothetical protein
MQEITLRSSSRSPSCVRHHTITRATPRERVHDADQAAARVRGVGLETVRRVNGALTSNSSELDGDLEGLEVGGIRRPTLKPTVKFLDVGDVGAIEVELADQCPLATERPVVMTAQMRATVMVGARV